MKTTSPSKNWTFETLWPARSENQAARPEWTMSKHRCVDIPSAAMVAHEWLEACALNGVLVAVRLVELEP